MDKDFVIVGDISNREAMDLIDFMNSRLDSKRLHKLVQEKASFVPIIYRGLKYRKKDLLIGHTYEHQYLLSSWSLSKEVAMSFCLDAYVPEKLLEEVAEEKGYVSTKLYTDHHVWDECECEYVNMLLMCENVQGFSVNKHVMHRYFSKEDEVIMYNGKWIFSDISYEKAKEGIPYVVVKAKWVPDHIIQAS